MRPEPSLEGSKTKTKTLCPKTETKTLQLSLETFRDQDLSLEKYTTEPNARCMWGAWSM